MENITSINKSLDNFEFSESYRGKAFVKNFNSHVDSLMETCSSLYDLPVIEDPNFNFTNLIYWQFEALILEKLDDVIEQDVLNALDNLEDKLYSTLIKNLGQFYRNGNTNWINKMLDMTINNIVLAAKYEYFSQRDHFKNPWIDAMGILIDNKLIYTFSDDVTELKGLGLKINQKESQLVSDKLIGVAGKGHKKDFATGYFRDLTALRNMLYNILDSQNNNSSNPLKREKIVDEIRTMGIKESELSDNNIQSWLINPLKRSNRIGSNKDGYFVIKNSDDLIISYNSHFENFKGFYRTLERHKRLAKQYDIPEAILNKHNSFIQDLNTDKNTGSNS
ncbi:hypothetical protein ACFQ3S_09870 [Mucilaginibacter terrae]|uniref:hypothetical protein n=1 Tax=Mucilaginibacter terrae TaxID=1955052 RepID=UPI00362703A5